MLLFELISSVVCICGFASLFAMALNIPYPGNANFWSGAGAFPAVLTCALTILSIWWAVDVSFRLKKAKAMSAPEGAQEKKPFREEFIGTRSQQKRFLFAIVAALIFVFALVPLFGNITRQFGFSIANFIFMFTTIKRFGETTWLKTAVISAVGAVIIYVVFSYVLRLPMPR